jgi:hypothetical protein
MPLGGVISVVFPLNVTASLPSVYVPKRGSQPGASIVHSEDELPGSQSNEAQLPRRPRGEEEDLMDERREMTVREAGRKGGEAAKAKHGRAHDAAIVRKGRAAPRRAA